MHIKRKFYQEHRKWIMEYFISIVIESAEITTQALFKAISRFRYWITTV